MTVRSKASACSRVKESLRRQTLVSFVDDLGVYCLLSANELARDVHFASAANSRELLPAEVSPS
jgi:hypothetical protein